MSEIKPVAWYVSKDPDTEQSPFTTADGVLASSYEQFGWNVTPLTAIPDTHRIVSVELLEAVVDDARPEAGALHKLRGIINKEPQK